MDSVQQPPFPVIPKASHVTIGVRRTMHSRQSINSVCATELRTRVYGVLPIRNLPHPNFRNALNPAQIRATVNPALDEIATVSLHLDPCTNDCNTRRNELSTSIQASVQP